MCGPTGSMFCTGLSVFGTLFLSLLAYLIGGDYPYAGEWFVTKGDKGFPPLPIAEQREAAVHNLWVAAAVYAALALASGLAVCTHKIRGTL